MAILCPCFSLYVHFTCPSHNFEPIILILRLFLLDLCSFYSFSVYFSTFCVHIYLTRVNFLICVVVLHVFIVTLCISYWYFIYSFACFYLICVYFTNFLSINPHFVSIFTSFAFSVLLFLLWSHLCWMNQVSFSPATRSTQSFLENS